MSKFAVGIIADQTFVYLTGTKLDNCDLETVSHKEAALWETKKEATEELSRVAFKAGKAPELVGFVEEVKDETEFRAREDTW